MEPAVVAVRPALGFAAALLGLAGFDVVDFDDVPFEPVEPSPPAAGRS